MGITSYVRKWVNKPKHLIFLLLLVTLLVFPAISSNQYHLGVLIGINVFAVLAASWDLIAGVAGQFSFGQVLFFGVAGYVSGALNIFLGLPPLLTIPLGGAFGVLVGLIMGLPSLRLKGPYFVIVSLSFPTILALVIRQYAVMFGGGTDFYGLSRISNDIVIEYYASVLLVLVSIFILLRILGSRVGLVLRSIRDDEDVAEATGINTTKYKLLAWAISGFFAGIAGGFQAHQTATIGISVFESFYSFKAIIFAVIGGLGTIIGSVGGTYLMIILDESLRIIYDLRSLAYAVVMIFVTLFIPLGLYRWFATHFDIQMGTWSSLKQLRRKKLDGSNP